VYPRILCYYLYFLITVWIFECMSFLYFSNLASTRQSNRPLGCLHADCFYLFKLLCIHANKILYCTLYTWTGSWQKCAGVLDQSRSKTKVGRWSFECDVSIFDFKICLPRSILTRSFEWHSNFQDPIMGKEWNINFKMLKRGFFFVLFLAYNFWWKRLTEKTRHFFVDLNEKHLRTKFRANWRLLRGSKMSKITIFIHFEFRDFKQKVIYLPHLCI